MKFVSNWRGAWDMKNLVSKLGHVGHPNTITALQGSDDSPQGLPRALCEKELRGPIRVAYDS